MIQVQTGPLWWASLHRLEGHEGWAEGVTKVVVYALERNPFIGTSHKHTAQGDLRRFTIAMGTHLADRRYSITVVYLYPLNGDSDWAELVLAQEETGW